MCGFETSKQAQVNQRAAQVGRRITNAFLLSECAQFGHSVQCVKGERVPDLGHAHKLWPQLYRRTSCRLDQPEQQ